jgi:hypothetical protein
MNETTVPKTPLGKLVRELVAAGTITEQQATALYSCVEVGYEGAPNDIARDLAPLMGHTPEGEVVVGEGGFALAEVPRWKQEFPDFGDELGIRVPPGWEDVSWHNDVCPSFSYEIFTAAKQYEYRCFVDYAAAGRRELEGPRFRLALFESDGGPCLCDVHETEDARAMEAFLALIAMRDEVLDWQASLGGEREGLDELCSFVDSVTDPEDKLPEGAL